MDLLGFRLEVLASLGAREVIKRVIERGEQNKERERNKERKRKKERETKKKRNKGKREEIPIYFLEVVRRQILKDANSFYFVLGARKAHTS